MSIRSRVVLWAVIAVGVGIASAAGFLVGRVFPATETKRVHVLAEPLVVSSQAGVTGVLPAGTALEYDTSFPEGFDRFRVILNVEGERLQLQEPDPPDLTDPLTSFGTGDRVEPSDARSVVGALGLTRQDLEQLATQAPP